MASGDTYTRAYKAACDGRASGEDKSDREKDKQLKFSH
jgi:hypothetical protein